MDNASLRSEISASPYQVLARLPALERIMIVTQQGGVTHERIGVVEKIRKDDDSLMCIGAAHDCMIDLRAIASVVVDRSGRMKDKVLPKLQFNDAAGDQVFSVVGLGGLEPFENVLSRFEEVRLEPKEKAASEPATLAANDAGMGPLDTARKSGQSVTVSFERAGVRQSWNGVLPDINPAMGFINIISGDFHLHVRGGTIARWERETAGPNQVRLTAIDTTGAATGLTLTGAKSAFEPA